MDWVIGVVTAIIFLFNLGCYVANENSWVWQLLLCRCSLLIVSNKKAQPIFSRPTTWFAWDLLDVKQLYSGPIGTPLLIFYRAFEFAVFLFVIIHGNIVYQPAGGGYFFIYFTNWTFVLFGLTGLCGCILTARHWQRQRRPKLPCIEATAPSSPTAGWSLPHRFYHLLLETICSASIMLTIFYWVADYMPGTPIRVDNPFKHGGSAFLLLIDLALSRVPIVSYHIQVVIAYGTLYLIFMWLYFAGTGFWVYRALDWSRSFTPVYYVILPLLLILGYIVMYVVVGIRELIITRRCFLQGTCCCCACCAGANPRTEGKLYPGLASSPVKSTEVATGVNQHMAPQEVVVVQAHELQPSQSSNGISMQ